MVESQIGFVFDFDGTLLDDIWLVREFPRLMAEFYQIQIPESKLQEYSQEIFEILSTTGDKNVIIRTLLNLAKRFGFPWYRRITFLKNADRIYKQKILDCPLFPNTIEKLREIAKTGPIGLFSTTPHHEIVRRCSNKPGLLELFGENIMAGDDSEHSKPDPEGLLKLSQKWGIPPNRLVMIGDMNTDTIPAKKVGAVAVGVLSGYATRQLMEEYGADIIIETVANLPDVIPQIRQFITRKNINIT
jgi:phosphoglycolate phosphatase-like HAD superfamily hydrolase